MAMRYAAWSNANESASVAHDDWAPGLGGIQHLDEAERRRIRETKTVPPHKCCTSPYWLYRIYQDTVVDVPGVLDAAESLVSGWAWDLPRGGVAAEPAFARAPARVTRVRCGAVAVGTGERRQLGINVTFDAPWTASILVGSARKQPAQYYEVYVEELQKAWSTTDTFVTITGDELGASRKYGVWVRAVLEAQPAEEGRQAEQMREPQYGPFSEKAKCET